MKRVVSRALVCVIALSVGIQAVAQTPPATLPRVIWQLDFHDSQCTITTGSETKMAASLWMTPGDPDPRLYLVGPSRLLPNPGDHPTIVTMPSGDSFQPIIGPKSGGVITRVIELIKLRDRFPGAFASASAVQLVARDKTTTFPVRGSSKAMAALQGCIDQKLAEWGIDPKTFDALRKPPTDIEGFHLFSPRDYPGWSMENNEQGRVIARINVDTGGKVTRCDVVVSSGYHSLDKKTCDAALAKGKFHPAIGADGNPTAAPRILNIDWRISAPNGERGPDISS